MLRLDLDLATPAEQLAADEVILDGCEAGPGGETLRFWEPRETFVVVGYANKVATEANLAACEQAGVPVFRRCSGGGTVVQMPGGLNYSLILRIAENSPTRTIASANQFIMARNRAAIMKLVERVTPCAPDGGQRTARPTVNIRGHTDLCLDNLKFAGNSQRRRKNFLLFHGTLLLDCDLKRIGELLRMPSLEPDYRAHRPHEEFVTNLNLPAETVKTALAKAWNANEPFQNPPFTEIKKLAQSKYSTREWNFKF